MVLSLVILVIAIQHIVLVFNVMVLDDVHVMWDGQVINVQIVHLNILVLIVIH